MSYVYIWYMQLYGVIIIKIHIMSEKIVKNITKWKKYTGEKRKKMYIEI